MKWTMCGVMGCLIIIIVFMVLGKSTHKPSEYNKGLRDGLIYCKKEIERLNK